MPRAEEPPTNSEIRVVVTRDADIVTARQRGRELAMEVGFSSCNATLVATAISELARNILLYAREGEIVLDAIERSTSRGVLVVALDHGPGISDLESALQDGYSTSRRLGLGLPGVRRLMDEFTIDTRPGEGTTVVVKKWNR